MRSQLAGATHGLLWPVSPHFNEMESLQFVGVCDTHEGSETQAAAVYADTAGVELDQGFGSVSDLSPS